MERTSNCFLAFRHSGRLGTVLSLSLAAFVAACNGSVSVPDTVPVKGTVTIKGKPAGGVRVTFHQLEKSDIGFVPIGDTGPDGVFKLSTGAPLNGAPPGDYIVTFERPIIDPKNPVETEIDAFLGKYSDPKQSQWKVTVLPSPNVFKFSLWRPRDQDNSR